MSNWQPIKTAPRDTPVVIRTELGRIFAARLMPDAAIDDDNNTCDAWGSEHEGLHPDCWTDGMCWTTNGDGDESDQPVSWLPL